MDAARLTGFERVRRFAGELEPSRIPPEVRHFASPLLLDTIGVAAARELEAAGICRNFAVAYKRFHDFDRNRKPEHYGPTLMPRPARA
jgi:hypothetical protein